MSSDDGTQPEEAQSVLLEELVRKGAIPLSDSSSSNNTFSCSTSRPLSDVETTTSMPAAMAAAPLEKGKIRVNPYARACTSAVVMADAVELDDSDSFVVPSDLDEDEVPGAFAEGGIAEGTSEEGANADSAPSLAQTNLLVNAMPVPILDLEIAQEVPSQTTTETESRSKDTKFPALLCVTSTVVLAVVLLLVLLGTKQDTTDSVPKIPSNSNHIQSVTNASQPELIIDLPLYTQEAIWECQDSPQARAYHWLLQDPFLSDYSHDRRVQRFALATLYYATDGENWRQNDHWLEYNTSECTDWHNKASYLPPYGVQACLGEDSLNALALVGGTMSGSLPRQLGLLRNLTHLAIGETTLTGSIPFEVWSLPQLWVLALHRNQLTGTLSPEGIEAARDSLYYLDLSGNELTGSLPTQMGLLRYVDSIGLGDNRLTGTLPSQLGAITSLGRFFLNWNSFTGTIPPTLFQGWGRLTELQLRDNVLTGTIPSQVGLLTSLHHLYLYNNSLTGPLPSELGALVDNPLLRLVVSNNELSGTIPDSIWHLSGLEEFMVDLNTITGTIPNDLGWTMGVGGAMREFDVRHNQMEGTIPSSLGLWTNAHRIFLHDNLFSGSFPTEIWRIPGLRKLSIGSNLTGSLPHNFSMPDMKILHLAGSRIQGTIPSQLCSRASGGILEFDCSQLLCGCDCSCEGG